MEEIRKAARKLDRQIGMLKFRFIGNLVIVLVLIGALIYVLTTERVYVINPKGGIWESSVENRTDPDILFIEADDHIRKFYGTFLTFNHADYQVQVPKAYSLGGNIIKEFHNTLKDNGFFNDIVSNNYRVKSEVKEVTLIGVDASRIKISVRGEMILENDFLREVRNMNMHVMMVLIPRVAVMNPHGLSIETIELPEGANDTLIKENL